MTYPYDEQSTSQVKVCSGVLVQFSDKLIKNLKLLG